MPEAPVIAGAEALFHEGDAVGVLVLHGFTGNPATMRPLADALVGAGFTVSMPRLPGHGTSIDDMLQTGWDDWSSAALTAYDELAARCEQVVIAGLSMGGTLTCWLAARRPDVRGIVCINALVRNADPGLRQMMLDMMEVGETVAPSIGSDIADPDSHEPAYEGMPLAPLLTVFDAIEALQSELPKIACPVLIMNSPQDHVVEPVNSDHLAEQVAGPVERVTLERSFHVATLDYDKDLVNERTVEFARRVTT